jgi:hypothetical protein
MIECQGKIPDSASPTTEPMPFHGVFLNIPHVMERLDSIEWFYEVGYGERRVLD